MLLYKRNQEKQEDRKMKKYPYSDSTDMVVYDQPIHKKKKSKTWRVALVSALSASVLTVALGSGVQLLYANHISSDGESGKVAYSTRQQSDAAATTLANKKSGEVLTIPEIAAKVGPSVVGVINKTQLQSQRYYSPFGGYYITPETDGELVEQGSGSGIIITTDGYVVTNQHVIDGASEIEVVINTGKTHKAEVVGQDTKTDLAVLKITPDADEELTAAVLGDSTLLEVGELAVAIGNPMGMEFSGSVTAGIVSAVNRTMSIDNRTYNLIQTDAAINSGNSGGALINQYGEVIGINSVKLSTSGVEGMGFAIAISEAKPIINDLMESGYVTGRPYVGISITETRYGLFITGIEEGSGAEEAGLKVDDMILEVDGTAVQSTSEINEIRDKKKPGDTLKFKVLRERETKEISVVLKESSQ